MIKNTFMALVFAKKRDWILNGPDSRARSKLLNKMQIRYWHSAGDAARWRWLLFSLNKLGNIFFYKYLAVGVCEYKIYTRHCNGSVGGVRKGNFRHNAHYSKSSFLLRLPAGERTLLRWQIAKARLLSGAAVNYCTGSSFAKVICAALTPVCSNFTSYLQRQGTLEIRSLDSAIR